MLGNQKRNTTPKYLPASKMFMEYGIPRSLLRSLADNGRVKSVSKLLPNCENVMKLYSVEDVKEYLNEE